jgi:hypothetical protein
MSSPHPTISAWSRDHDSGAYQAEIDGWSLEVRWTPNERERRGSFSWTAAKDDLKEAAGRSFEEMVVAMAHAERFARDGTSAGRDIR